MKPTSEASLARRLVALLVSLVAATAGIIALLCVVSLGIAALSDLIYASVPPDAIAPNPDSLSTQWPTVRPWLMVCTAVAILAGMGAWDLLHSARPNPAGRRQRADSTSARPTDAAEGQAMRADPDHGRIER